MLVNRRHLRIEWGDCDPAGIIWYPRYFGMFDAATAGLFEAAGWVKPVLQATFEIVGFPMVDTRARFLVPSRYGDDVVVESRVAKWNRSSFEVEHRLLKGDVLAVEGWETRVWVGRHPEDPERIKSKPIPQEVIDRFERG